MSEAGIPPASHSLKEQGNELFKAGKYQQACELYTAALEQQPEDAALFSNRAAARLKLGEAEAALADAQAATDLRPEWDKGYFRKGCALQMLGRPLQALEAFEAGLDANPHSKELVAKVKQLKQETKQERASQHTTDEFAGRMRAPARVGVQGPAAWAQGLSQKKQYEWLVDCYRMRVDDDYAWGGGNLHGLYSAEVGLDVVTDFWVFCKLAQRHGVIPRAWDWANFLRTAKQLLPYAFEKADAKDKYGGENNFSAFLGGRSLRATGEAVYGSSCMTGDASEEAMQLEEQLPEVEDALTQRRGPQAEALFADVGGLAAWSELAQDLQLVHSH